METKKKNPLVLTAAIIGAVLWAALMGVVIWGMVNYQRILVGRELLLKPEMVEYSKELRLSSLFGFSPDGFDFSPFYMRIIMPVILAAATALNIIAWRKDNEKLVLISGLVSLAGMNIFSAVICLVEFALAKTRGAEAPVKTGARYFLDGCTGLIKPSGRAARAEFWCFWLYQFFIVVIILVLALIEATSQNGMKAGETDMSLVVFGIYSGLLAIAAVLIGIRRMHDLDKRGAFILIPLLNIILCFVGGTAVENRFGLRRGAH